MGLFSAHNRTLLISAALNGNSGCIRSVGIDGALDISHRDNNGCTALDIANRYGYHLCQGLLEYIEKQAEDGGVAKLDHVESDSDDLTPISTPHSNPDPVTEASSGSA